jgi:hypothetical protein
VPVIDDSHCSVFNCNSIVSYVILINIIFSIIGLIILLDERPACLHVMLLSLCSSRNIGPCTKVMFQ